MREARRLSASALLMLPGGLVVYFAFNSGGFYAGAPAYVATLLCLFLALRVVMSRVPFAGWSWELAVAGGAFAGFALLTVVSGLWSHAPGVARVELDLPLVYLLAMLLFGSMARTRGRLRWVLRGLAMGCVIVCGCGLITRLLPHVWPTSPEVVNNRLSFPVTYWNVLGLVAAIGVVLCVHLSSDSSETKVGRVAAAAATPIVSCTLYFTFSRGAIGACIVALVIYALVGRPRLLLSCLLSIGPSTAVALKVAYDANLLATLNPTTPGALTQGRHVAVAVAFCVGAAALIRVVLTFTLDRQLRRIRLPLHVRRQAALAGWISLGAATVLVVIALHGTISREYHRFVNPTTPVNLADLRTRLTDPGNNGRIAMWKIAWRQFKSVPAGGKGAGTFKDAWARYRPVDFDVIDAHSLYLETLDELGVIGFALLLITILTVLIRAASRCRGSGRPLYACVLAILLAWTFHAGVDWDWEMPVVSVIFFSLGGFVLARRERRGRDGEVGARGKPPLLPRVPIVIGLLVLALLPAFTWASQRHLDAAAYAFSHGDCGTARSAAMSSISTLGNRAEPYEIVGYCDLRLGMQGAAVKAIGKAVSLDPHDWTYRYDQALIEAAAGLDPRAIARYALMLNPLDPDVQDEVRMFSSGTPAEWKSEASDLASTFTSL